MLNFLEETWSIRDVEKFINEVDNILELISKKPYLFEASRKSKNIRKGLITKHNTLYYRVKPKKQEIELITFWDNRQDPKKLIL